MKKFVASVLTASMLMSAVPTLSAELHATDNGVRRETKNEFTTVKIEYPENIRDNDKWRAVAVYGDTGEKITLSENYDGYMWATVPTENINRTFDVVVPEKVQFTDIDDTGDYFNIEWLSRTDVIRGNENGEAKPFDNVTRAEAVAMVMRFMGLEGIAEQKSGAVYFDDVTRDDWFYSVVSYAFECGIVKGDSESTFSPHRSVTREEITAMAARGLQYAGLRCVSADNGDVVDLDKISDWAKASYDIMGMSCVADFDVSEADELGDNIKRMFNPQQAATRADIAYILNNASGICQLYPSQLAEKYGFDEQMPVIDGSTSTYPFTNAVYSALFSRAELHPDYPEKHSKSHASYERLINGEVDMLFASVYPASDILALAAEKGVELELIPIAYDAMVFFTNKDNTTEGLTSRQISDIYVNNAYHNWSEMGGADALLYPYCRNSDSGSHAQMEKHFLNGNEIHPEVQKETSTTMANVLTDVIAAKTDDPVGYGLGYSIYYYYHNMFLFYPVEEELKLLAIDGVMPTDETIADGTYPLSNNTYVVLRKDTPENSQARKMAEFMLTEAGQACVEAAGFGKLKGNAHASEDLSFADKINTYMPQNENYMFSPLSIKMALALAANGAVGDTKSEILAAADISDIDEFNTSAKEMIEKYNSAEVLNVKVANSLWINSELTPYKFTEKFKSVAAEYYTAEAREVKNDSAVGEINAWVNEKTNGKITKLIDKADFLTMLVNAVYFKGAWQNEFSERATRADTFHNADGTTAEADFMNDTDWRRYAETNSLKMIELPYKNSVDKFSADNEYLGTDVYDDLNISMYLVTGNDDIDVERELSAAIEDGLFERTYVHLSMPKFEMEYSVGMNEMLENMGIVTAFSAERADFSKMYDGTSLCITDTMHKTYIKVDEKGTEAAAVTAIMMAGTSMPPEPIELKLDNPFWFVIRDNTSGEVLFMGRVAKLS